MLADLVTGALAVGFSVAFLSILVWNLQPRSRTRRRLRASPGAQAAYRAWAR